MLIHPLSDEDILGNFDCGVNALNIFINKNALNYQKSFSSKTYLLKSEENILGFYCISNTLIEQNQVDIRWPKHPLPAILRGRLGVHLNSPGKGIGSILFADACKKVVDISNIVGCVGLVTDAKDQSAINFY